MAIGMKTFDTRNIVVGGSLAEVIVDWEIQLFWMIIYTINPAMLKPTF
jgi:hypothetical protein